MSPNGSPGSTLAVQREVGGQAWVATRTGFNECPESAHAAEVERKTT